MSDRCIKKEYKKTDLTLLPTPNNFGMMVKRDLKDVSPISIGRATVAPGKQVETNCIDNTHLFFSCEGSGSFRVGETRYHIKEHEFFVLPIGTVTYLCADLKTSWTYRWIGFTGELANDFMDFPAVFTLPEELVATLYDPGEEERNLSSRLAGDLYRIHAQMHKPEKKEPDYIQTIINRVNTSYMEKLTVTEMAKELGLDRSHLSRLFKARMDITIQDYLLHFRITKAKQYLLKGHSVTDTAALCGFGDRINFSRVFLKETGCRPTQWIKYLRQQGPNRPR